MAFNTYPCNPWPISTEQLNKGNNDDLNTRVAALEGEVSDLSDTKTNQITIAPFFDPAASYEVGDLVYYNGVSYRCTNDHEGEWDADDFAVTTIAGELDTLKSGLIALSGAYIVVKSDVLTLGNLLANSSGYTTIQFTVPSGYATTGIYSITKRHPQDAATVNISLTLYEGETGTTTIYVSYSAVEAVVDVSSDYVVSILCKKL